MDYNPVVQGFQDRLAMLGWYTGEIDGLYGPMTKQAVIDFRVAHGFQADDNPLFKTMPLAFSKEARPRPENVPETPGPLPGLVPPQLLGMRALVGLREAPGASNNPRIRELAAKAGLGDNWQDVNPWCAVALNGVLVEAGYPSTKSALAQSFRKYGQQVSIKTLQPGDITVVPRGSLSWQGHVEMVDKINGDGTAWVIGANVSDQVKRYKRVLKDVFHDGARRPQKA